ncbi:unnamed protein product [Camellia sinensis]
MYPCQERSQISFLVPNKTQLKLQPFNLHPNLITFIPITVPHVPNLPPGSETTSDVPYPLQSLLMTAMDNTEHDIENLLRTLQVDVVFFDFTHWMPALARRLGIKSVHYCIISPATIGYTLTPERQLLGRELTHKDLMQLPAGYPVHSINLNPHEARAFAARPAMQFGNNSRFCERQFVSLSQCDALGFGTCREIEGPYSTYFTSVLLSEPVIPEPPTSPLEEKWATWLGQFEPRSVIYCAFGSECNLKMKQFQELVLGLELSGLPFLAALKPPIGSDSVQAALPEKFVTRVEQRGIVHGGWVQQQVILEHSSVGCFITHCGSGSLPQALVNTCQLVLLPNVGNQIINARMMSRNLKVGVEVEKGEDGLFTRESVCRAVRVVMDEESEIGKEVRENHGKTREFLLNKDLESSYIDDFNKKLHGLL